jgi:hypothetical protein
MAYEIGRRRLLAGGLVLGLAVAGCGTTSEAEHPAGDPGPGTINAEPGVAVVPTGATEADARKALTYWASFPVDAGPRPVVLADGQAVLAPATGFPAAGDAKASFVDGRFAFPARLPSGPARVGGLPVISAREAVALLRAETGTGGRGVPVPPLLAVTGIRLGTASFFTDRGNRSLPAWLFSFRGVKDPAPVLAVARSARFVPKLPVRSGYDPSLGNATLGGDGKTISMGFLGAPGGTPQCDQKYVLRVVESRAAVALRIGLVPADDRAEEGGSKPPTACEDATYHRSATVTLSAPLGARVLISAVDATPLAVAGA